MRGDGGLGGIVRYAVGRGETILGLFNLAGGARNVFQIKQHPVEERFLADAVGRLVGLGVVRLDNEVVEAGEECRDFAAGGEVGGVVPPKSLDAGCAVVTALVMVIHIFLFRNGCALCG